jgi:deoxyribose-phosphate aldolase
VTIEPSLNGVLEGLLRSESIPEITAEQLIHCIDLTLLDEHATPDSLAQLKHDATKYQVAAVCVFSKHLSEFQVLQPIELATVINFPQGNDEITHSLDAIEQAVLLQATEIDYVLPYQLYLAGNKSKALKNCQTIIESCKKHNLNIKIILETGALSSIETIYEVSLELIYLGCDFLKTSTGKIAQGASLSAAFAMLSAIKDTNSECGLKISGGIKTPEQAIQYAKLAEMTIHKPIDKSWFRVGASSLLHELLK